MRNDKQSKENNIMNKLEVELGKWVVDVETGVKKLVVGVTHWFDGTFHVHVKADVPVEVVTDPTKLEVTEAPVGVAVASVTAPVV